jgi:hypothetical protein
VLDVGESRAVVVLELAGLDLQQSGGDLLVGGAAVAWRGRVGGRSHADLRALEALAVDFLGLLILPHEEPFLSLLQLVNLPVLRLQLFLQPTVLLVPLHQKLYPALHVLHLLPVLPRTLHIHHQLLRLGRPAV